MFNFICQAWPMSPSRGANNPTVAAGHQRWRTMNAQQRKDAIVGAVDELSHKQGYPPLRGELAEHCGMDLKTIRRYLHTLVEEGVLEEPGGVGSRTLRRVKQAAGAIAEAAGSPGLAETASADKPIQLKGNPNGLVRDPKRSPLKP